MNCLIGPGDTGKSAILDAIELCLSTRRTASVSDADFYQLSTDACISITITIGDLDEQFLDLDQYGIYLRGFNTQTSTIEDEPAEYLETVLSTQVTVGVDLEPRWKLTSERAIASGVERDISYSARLRLAPTRLGPVAIQHLSWGPRSILNRFATDAIADAGAALAVAAREARVSFGREAKASLEKTLATVAEVSGRIGVDLGEGPQALLDAHGVSFTGGVIALHNADGVPLRNLGLGSSRLLVAALQLEAGRSGAIAMIDEIEHGLEPHRIMRLLHTLGAKESAIGSQVFITTHSPVVVRELSASQIAVVRRSHAADYSHNVKSLEGNDQEQKTLRACAEAFLSKVVIVCEGETEVGLLRGIDLHRQRSGSLSLTARGVSFALGSGDSTFGRALTFAELGYATAILRDDDKPVPPELVAATDRLGVEVINWGNGYSTEDCLFQTLPDKCIDALLTIAIELNKEDAVRDHISNCSKGALALNVCSAPYSDMARKVLGEAARRYKWFKSISAAEIVGELVVGTHLDDDGTSMCGAINRLIAWAEATSSPTKNS